MDQELIKAYRFFREFGGAQIVGECAKYSIALARAELAAERNGWTFKWEYDDLPWEADDSCPVPSEVMVCLAYDGRGKLRASLGGIGDPSRAYVRLIEAELALEGSADSDDRPCVRAPAFVASLEDCDRAYWEGPPLDCGGGSMIVKFRCMHS